MTWETIVGSQAPKPNSDLEEFLRLGEPLTTVMADHFFRAARFADSGKRKNVRIHYWKDRAALLQTRGGLLLPVGMGSQNDFPGVSRELRRKTGLFPRIRTIMGAEADVDTCRMVFSLHASDTVRYDLMQLPCHKFPPVQAPPAPGLAIARPTAENWRDLMQLQTAYEVEEVLLPGRVPVAAHSKAHLLESLTTQRVLVAVHGGRAIARVATNARGISTEQIGGVYTDPAWRRRGISRWLMSHLFQILAREGKNASLFVKKENEAALRLYYGMGFAFVSPFRISYYP